MWLRMMFLGHDSDRYGYLQQNGKAIPPESIARRCGCTPEQYLTLLLELDEAGVPSRTPEGIIYSRRMVKDAKLREQTAERVRKYNKRNKVSNAGVTHVLTPNYEDEDEDEKKSVVSIPKKEPEIELRLETFDPERAFDALCRSFPKPMRGPLAEQAFFEAVEREAKSGKRRSEIADWIIGQARAYAVIVGKRPNGWGLRNWLIEGVYSWEPELWRQSDELNAKRSNGSAASKAEQRRDGNIAAAKRAMEILSGGKSHGAGGGNGCQPDPGETGNLRGGPDAVPGATVEGSFRTVPD